MAGITALGGVDDLVKIPVIVAVVFNFRVVFYGEDICGDLLCRINDVDLHIVHIVNRAGGIILIITIRARRLLRDMIWRDGKWL